MRGILYFNFASSEPLIDKLSTTTGLMYQRWERAVGSISDYDLNMLNESEA